MAIEGSSARRCQDLLNDARQCVGAQHVCNADQISERYGSTTTGFKLEAAGAIAPADVGQVQQIVGLAAAQTTSLYPISTGNNWGYGAASPVTRDSVILDLRRLVGIDDRDIDLGVITLEPGVTQQALRDFLDAKGYDFLVPVHGGGPNCSILGNCLERGYGITPFTDHFGSLTTLQAVLSNGELYRTPITEQGGTSIDRLFKWGVGPYADGLFTQAAFGIVVSASIVLAPRPDRIESFVFRVRHERNLPEVAAAVRRILRALPGTVSGINLMNSRRVLSMMVPYPADGRPGVIDDEKFYRLARQNKVTPWTGLGALYGDPRVIRAAKKLIRSELKGVASRPLFVQPDTIAKMTGLLSRLPSWCTPGLRNYLRTLNKSLSLIRGNPSEVALALAYWKQGGVGDRTALDPARDQCGIIWYAPLLPMRPKAVTDYVAMAERVCREHEIEPLLTLTTLSDRCFDSTLPLLFDPSDPAETARAQNCYRALLDEGRKQGVLPYRYPVHAMPQLVDPSQCYWRFIGDLKRSVDPQGIIAPGRYC